MNEINRLLTAGVFKMGEPGRSLTIGGVPMKMTDSQYVDYMERSSALVGRKLRSIVNSSTYARLSDARKAKLIEKVIQAACKRAQSWVKRQMWGELKLSLRDCRLICS